MNHLLDHDHSELDAALNDVFSAFDAGKAQLAFEHLDVFWARLAVHIRAEHIHLFPALLSAAKEPLRRDAPPREEINAAIVRLRTDHDYFMSELAAAMKELRVLRRQDGLAAPQGAFAGVRERIDRVSIRLAAHNSFEESRPYRWVCALLEPAEQQDLLNNIDRELKNLPPRFKSRAAPSICA